MISPSRTNKPSSFTHFPYGRGVSERRWRSAANRPSRQARRGWASLYKAHSLKKRTTSRVQQKFNSPKFSLTPTSPPQRHLPFPQKIPPHAPPSQTLADSGFFGPNTGQFGSDSGYFGSILGRFWAFPGQNHAVLGPTPPSLEPSLPRGDVQKLHLPLSARGRSLFTSLSQIYTK